MDKPISEQKIIALDACIAFRKACKEAGKRVVFTNGCFDILHVGHTTYLQQAKALGDVLVIGLNSDASVKTLKGPKRPINSEKDRASVLAALEAVDRVVIFGENTPVELLETLKPDIHVKGGDYIAENLPEFGTITRNGGVVKILPFVQGKSTTAIIEKF